MIGLTIILYLVSIALIRMKTIEVTADIALMSEAANDPLQHKDLRIAASASVLAAAFVLLWWRFCYVLATVGAVSIIVYLW